MAEKFVVKAEKRDERGTNAARRLRREGRIPANVYGGGEDNVAVHADHKELAAILRSDTGANTLFTLDIDGVGEARVIFQDRQIDPVHGRLLHADLRRLAKGEKIEVTVPVHLIGTPEGVREEGGLLEQQLREIRVSCTPSKIPESIDVNVESLMINDSISIAEISVDDEIEILESPGATIASVVFVKEPELEPEVEEELEEPVLIGEDGEPIEVDEEAGEGEEESQEGDSE
ncbi:MAG: 50S ribosomal protein L25 [Acidobacteria bacterium]|nr:MAG: 50S ribosomal protein L25 [Acidobacteriota bacterium]REK01305.1 MAG: 50S ribosomal protein L25 [Acidobacteriota bacterium]REK14261.1 MAG: 50S ribosomal protein L25 [Acidobacteriota bacterium]REK44976.1 MAG: 50S ribosomal protein L25 [Acidobacteriota bacterium]